MARDEFSQLVALLLAKRVGMRCSNPDCRKLTSGPRDDPAKAINIGVAAHITAASEGGPRFDAALDPGERASAANGIWLCQNCGKLVDNDVKRFPAEKLRTWKADAEATARAEVEGKAIQREAAVSATLELDFDPTLVRQERHEYALLVTVKNVGTKPITSYYVEVSFPRAPLPANTKYMMEVENRGDPDNIFLRLVSEQHRPGKAIYPGDSEVVMKIDYYLDHDLFLHRHELFHSRVTAKLVVEGCDPVIAEVPFSEIQIF